jgi:hypothetical protein
MDGAEVGHALVREQSQRASSQEQLRAVLREEQELNAELLRTSQEIERALAAAKGAVASAEQAQPDASPEPEPESAAPRILLSEPSCEFSPERLGWSVEAFGGAAVGEGERLQLTSSQAHRYGSVYENQRRRLGVFGSRDYDASNLTRADREGWTDEAGEPRLREPLPPGMTWVVNADRSDTDAEGWMYAFKFGDEFSDHERGKLSWVRRREWIVATIAAADAAVPEGWAARLGPEVHLADSPTDAETIVVEVRQARRVSGAAAGDDDAADVASAARSSLQADEAEPLPKLCARVTWKGQTFETERSVHPGASPIWFNADNNLNCRQCLSISEEAKRSMRSAVHYYETSVVQTELRSPVTAVRVWTEEWVNLKIDRVEFVYADGATAKYGTPSAEQGTAGAVKEYCMELNAPNEYLVCVKTLTDRRQTRSSSRAILSGLVFTTSLGRSWAVGRQNEPTESDDTAEAPPQRAYVEEVRGVQANGQSIVGLRVTQSWEGWLSRIDGINVASVHQPMNEAAIAAMQAQAGQVSPWTVAIPAAWCGLRPRPPSGGEDLQQLTIELISPGRDTMLGSVPERSYGMVEIPDTVLVDSVGCDGWYVLSDSLDAAPASEAAALGEVRVAWSFLAAPVPSDLPQSAVPSPSALFRRHTKSTRTAVSSRAVDGMGFKIQEHALHSWMIGLSHGLCIEETARKAWSNYDFVTATPETTWQMVEKYGVPAQLRVRIWPFITGADKLKAAADCIHGGSGTVYQSLCQRYEAVSDDQDPKAQIRKDLTRTFPEEMTEINTERGIAALERLVGAYAMYNTRVGYCQSMNLIGGHLILALGRGGVWADPLSEDIEETAFWLLRYLAEEIVPHYWSMPNMPGMMHHTDVLDELCRCLTQTMLSLPSRFLMVLTQKR